MHEESEEEIRETREGEGRKEEEDRKRETREGEGRRRGRETRERGVGEMIKGKR